MLQQEEKKGEETERGCKAGKTKEEGKSVRKEESEEEKKAYEHVGR